MGTSKDLSDHPVPARSPSSLDPLEIAVELEASDWHVPEIARSYISFSNPDYTGRPATKEETAFRHSGWKMRRLRTCVALCKCHVGSNRIARFMNCGSSCFIERSPSEDRWRIVADLCHDRWCVPCQVARAQKFRRRLLAHADGKSLRLMTLTLRHSEQRLSDTIDRIYEAFRRLRGRDIWKGNVIGAAAVLELTLSKSGHWHPHLHVIWEGSYIPQDRLASAWLAVTVDSFIVDVRPIRSLNDAARYVAKYLAKGVPNEVTHDEARFMEAMVSLKGRQMLLTLGEWRKLDPGAEEDPDPGDWKVVCNFNELVAGLREGREWAIGLKKALLANKSPPGRK